MAQREIAGLDQRLEEVINAGFACETLDRLGSRRSTRKPYARAFARPPTSLDAFLAQERNYNPDLNDGVRVNIAPLQRAGFLAADVLAAKVNSRNPAGGREPISHERSLV